MAHARKTGTAWDKRKEDYAYTRELEGTGWAWEFLRRNAAYRDDFREGETHAVVVARLPGGTAVYKPAGRHAIAEGWGLALFADPDKTALAQDLFWLPEVTTYTATCTLHPAADGASDPFSLDCFKCRTAILLKEAKEIVTVRTTGKVATVSVMGGSILAGRNAVTFSHEGFNTLSRHCETLRILQQLMDGTSKLNAARLSVESKHLAYLIALDGHLEGWSYRDIAEVLYGADCVGSHWTDDTRWMKSKVRRAVQRGIALMNGGYRDLL